MPKLAPLENVLSVRSRLGEGPIWDAQKQLLYWVDIYNRRIHSFDPATEEADFSEIDTVVSGLFIVDEKRLIVAQENSLGQFDLTTQKLDPIVSIEADRPGNRLNDVRCDSRDRLWIGTMNAEREGQASLYRYDPDGLLRCMETGLSISNGLGWSPDHATFYLTDSPRQVIYAYHFNEAIGEISDRRPLVDLSHESFFPDGLTIDAEGCIWSAMWNGGCVIRFDPDGQEMLRVSLPVPLVTSCTFGGPNLTDLYITTASAGMTQAELKTYYQAGDLFRLSTDIEGLPSDRYSRRGG